MNALKIQKTLERIEKNTNVLNEKLCGWNAWGIFRIHLATHLLQPSKETVNWDKNRIFKRIKNPFTIWRYIKSYIKFKKILSGKNKKCDILLKTITSARRDMVEGKYKDIYFDDIIRNSNLDFYVIESLGSASQYLKPTYNKVDFYSEGMALYSKSKKIHPNEIDNIIDAKEEILKELIKLGDVHEDILSFIEKEFESRIINFFKLKKTYKELMQKLNPKAFLMTCCYGSEALVAAAKELGIVTIETQHGAMDHAGYNYGKHLLKYKKHFPISDYILTHNKIWADYLIDNTFRNKEEVFIVGNPRIDFWKSKICKKKKDNTVDILVSSVNTKADSLIEFLSKTLNILRSYDIKVNIKIKLHPNEKCNIKKWNRFKKQNQEITLIGIDSLNLYEYLVQSDFHISIYSSIHHEAINFGIPTGVLNIEGWKGVSEIVDSGAAEFIENPKKLVDMIIHTHNKDEFYKKWANTTILNSKKYQEEDAINKNIEVIKKILSKKYHNDFCNKCGNCHGNNSDCKKLKIFRSRN